MSIEKGFYYHYKHDSQGPIQKYVYEVIGSGKNTEDESIVVIYRPLYESTFAQDVDFLVRPYDMFIESVTKDGKTFPRFHKVTDPEVIAKLEQIRDTMYK